ncbi:hypothetical protein ROHU_002761 [Labeo rohita]|uniref:Uncharacterized protein n=1 Tax=Labeo rohita TaxID=84645 RepID=A0A498NY35_LABRO|nr:hypothetical protein ROHU_002761 [Labeo rohita]
MDHHLTTHTELTKAAQRDALQACKRRKILEDLASLRASNPEEPMVSTLDLDEPRTSGMFLRPRKRNVATRGARRSQVTRVARNLLSSLSSSGEKEGKGPEKSISEPEKEPATGPAEEEGPGPSKNHNLLKSDPEKKHQWSFYGHLTTYWASIYGHRSGVFQNLTIQEVVEARQRASEGCFVIEILAHKTNQAFGAAQLALDQEEYVWLEQFLSIRSTLVGGNDTKYFFFTSKPSSCKNLNQYFQEAWASMGLPGTPTFTDMRTTIATHAKNTHTSEDRHKVAQFMCHDTATAGYALNLDAKQAAEHRRLFDAAVVGEEDLKKKDDETPKEARCKVPLHQPTNLPTPKKAGS